MSDTSDRGGPRGPRKTGGPRKPGGPGGPRKPFGKGRDGEAGHAPRGERSFRGRDDKERSFGGKEFGGKGFGGKGFGKGFREERGGEGRGGERRFDERPGRDRDRYGDRPEGGRDRAERRFGERAGGERAVGERPFRKPREGFRPAPGGEDRPFRSRAPRQFGEAGADGERPRSSSRPERRPSLPREGRPERLKSPEKEGGLERIAKVIARAGAASRRDAEELIAQGRVAVNGETIASPALDVAPDARITIDGEALPARERTRLWLYHKPAGLVTTNHDPEGRATVFETLPEDLPRVISIGRLDINTEGLLLLTNDGGLARVLGHPETAWLRRYRVRAYGHVGQDQLDKLRDGVTLDGEAFGPVIATRDREVGDNTWLTVDLREGKNREVKRVLEHLGLNVNRLIRISFGPFQLGDLAEGAVEEIRTKVLREQLGDQLAAIAGADFEAPMRAGNRLQPEREERGGDRGGDRWSERRSGGREERPARREGFGGKGRFEERGRFEARGPREGTRDDKPPRRPREGAYHRAREERGDAPADILLRAEEGRGAIWRDPDTTQMKPKRTGPRRGADPREERAARDAGAGRERVRAAPIADPKGRRVQVERVQVERVSGPSPDLPRKPRYTRADFAKEGGRGPARDFGGERSREGRPSGGTSFGGQSFEGKPFRGKSWGDRPDGDAPRSPRPPRREGERSFEDRPRGERSFGGKSFGGKSFGGKSFGGKGPGRPGGGAGRPAGKGPGRPGGGGGFRPRSPRG
jgi:23S rRNA pseudouridine2605 synthase